MLWVMFISNNRASFHLWWKENLLKHQSPKILWKSLLVVKMTVKFWVVRSLPEGQDESGTFFKIYYWENQEALGTAEKYQVKSSYWSKLINELLRSWHLPNVIFSYSKLTPCKEVHCGRQWGRRVQNAGDQWSGNSLFRILYAVTFTHPQAIRCLQTHCLELFYRII